MITADAKLQVKLPPVMIDDASTRTVRVKVGETARLTCEATGFPTPRMTWSRADGHLLPSGRENITVQTYVMTGVKKVDRGEYKCFAHNDVGEGQSRSVHLEVEFAPSIEIPRPRIAQASGYDAKLNCEIAAFPAPAIFWEKDGEVITNSDRIKISHFASQNDVTTSTISVIAL